MQKGYGEIVRALDKLNPYILSGASFVGQAFPQILNDRTSIKN
jgi:hypothetical protein